MVHQQPSRVSFACAVSRQVSSLAAAKEVAEDALDQLDGRPNIALLFFTADHAEHAREVSEWLVDRLQTDCLLGCSGESIVGGDIEIEGEPGMSLWLADLPNTTIHSMKLEFVRTAGGGSFVGWPDALPEQWPDASALILLGDPFSFPADVLLEQLNDQQRGTPVVGGMASAAHQPGENRLIFGSEVVTEGAVALWIDRGVQVQTVVSQGCRPIGEPFVITSAERNVIHALGGASAYQRLEEVFVTLPTSEQRSMQGGLHVGRVVSEYQESFGQGDFLVRNVVGIDREEGSIAIGDFVRPGQTVQFHIRDADSADGELRQLLAQSIDRASPPAAALLFTCNGRGTRLFAEPHHDVQAVRSVCGPLPVAGFFAAGELGPIGGQNFLHGFTASIALFEQPEN